MTDKEKLRALLMTIMLGDYWNFRDAAHAAGVELDVGDTFSGWIGPRIGGYFDGSGIHWKPTEKGLKFLAEE